MRDFIKKNFTVLKYKIDCRLYLQRIVFLFLVLFSIILLKIFFPLVLKEVIYYFIIVFVFAIPQGTNSYEFCLQYGIKVYHSLFSFIIISLLLSSIVLVYTMSLSIFIFLFFLFLFLSFYIVLIIEFYSRTKKNRYKTIVYILKFLSLLLFFVFVWFFVIGVFMDKLFFKNIYIPIININIPIDPLAIYLLLLFINVSIIFVWSNFNMKRDSSWRRK